MSASAISILRDKRESLLPPCEESGLLSAHRDYLHFIDKGLYAKFCDVIVTWEAEYSYLVVLVAHSVEALEEDYRYLKSNYPDIIWVSGLPFQQVRYYRGGSF